MGTVRLSPSGIFVPVDGSIGFASRVFLPTTADIVVTAGMSADLATVTVTPEEEFFGETATLIIDAEAAFSSVAPGGAIARLDLLVDGVSVLAVPAGGLRRIGPMPVADETHQLFSQALAQIPADGAPHPVVLRLFADAVNVQLRALALAGNEGASLQVAAVPGAF